MDGVIKRSDPTEDYELLQKVGGGTFGEVYKSRNIRTGELAAVKVVKLEAGDNFAVIQQEIIVLKDCVHPNIISYYGSYLRRDRLWIVMEYCSGGSLQDIYQLTGPLMELQIAFVCRETLKGLQYLHRRGKIHRDVKGANILLTHSGDVKLADFGVAAQITATLGKRKSFIGTPYWMAPEVASVERRGGYGSECDVWAVGITAIELGELQPPLFDLHPMQVLYLMTKSSYKSPRLKDKQKWSLNFQDFVKSCLTKNPKKRPAPEKLLSSHPFVIGALSSRLTRDLLDRVNNPGSSRLEPPSAAPAAVQQPDSLNHGMNLELNEAYSWESVSSTPSDNEHESSPRPFRELNRGYYDERTLPAKEHPPLPDVVSGDSLLNDRNGVIHDDEIAGTLTNRKVSAQDFVRRKFRIEDALRVRTDFRVKADRSASLDFPNSIRVKDCYGVKIRFPPLGQIPLSNRPATCYGLPPTPQVSMGACFFNIFHNCQFRVNHTAFWTHPLSKRQYLFVGADEGIYSLDLGELHEASMALIHERRCSWLYIIDNVLMAIQGKTPYLYRHDLLQLIQQQPITQKLTKTMTRIPEKFKPKLLLATIRIPETRDCLLCSVDRNAFNDNLFMCCAIPNAVLLFQWYEPLSKFIMLKKVEIDRFPQLPQRPFHLMFTSTSDYPQVCIGVYKSDEADKLDFHTVSFDDVGKLEDFLVQSRNTGFCDVDTLKPYSNKVVSWESKTKLDVMAMKQLDRDTIMLCYDNKVILTNLEGHFKQSKLMHTSFTFNFPIDFAIPLPDSVLAFHRHGIQGRSFFNGSITQDLHDPSKVYQVVGSETLVVLKSRTLNLVKHSASSGSIIEAPVDPVINRNDEDETRSTTALPDNTANSSDFGFDLCVLTGHVSTLNT